MQLLEYMFHKDLSNEWEKDADFQLVNMCVCLVAQSCPTLCNPIDCNLPGSSIHGILQTRTLE